MLQYKARRTPVATPLRLVTGGWLTSAIVTVAVLGAVLLGGAVPLWTAVGRIKARAPSHPAIPAELMVVSESCRER